VSASTYPVLIDTFPSYRDYSFFVVEDEIVFVDRERRVVDVVPAGPRTRFSGHVTGGGSSGLSGSNAAAIDLPADDIRIVQRVLIERGLLGGEADGVFGPQTREALMTYQRQQGIQVSGSIDARTVSSLGVSNRLSAQASQSLQAQSTTAGQQGQAGQPLNQQNATGQSPNQQNVQSPAPSNNQATNAPASQSTQQPSTTTGQAPPAQQNTTGQAQPQTSNGNSAPLNQTASPPHQPSLGSQPAQNSTSNR